MKPPRPAPIVAAAVLLIVVGSELILAGIAGILWLVITAGADGCVCCAALLLAFGSVIGLHFLATGINALTSDLVNPIRASKPVLVIGGFSVVPSLFSLGLLMMSVRAGRTFFSGTFSQDDGLFVGGVLVLCANTAMLLSAAWLLRKNATEYVRWKETIRQVLNGDGYELGEDE